MSILIFRYCVGYDCVYQHSGHPTARKLLLTSPFCLMLRNTVFNMNRNPVFPSFGNISEPQHDKTNKVSVRPAKTQISLGIRPVWSESSLSAWRKLGSLAPMKRTAKTLIRLGGCPGWSESSLGAHSPCWFWHIVAHIRLSWVFGIDRNIRQDDSIIGHIPIHLHQIIWSYCSSCSSFAMVCLGIT